MAALDMITTPVLSEALPFYQNSGFQGGYSVPVDQGGNASAGAQSAALYNAADTASNNVYNPVNAPQGQFGVANAGLQTATSNADQQLALARTMGTSYMPAIQAAAAGNGPSVAGAQYQQALDANDQAGMSAQSTGRGNAALAAHNAGSAVANANNQSAMSSASQRQAEIMNAYGQEGKGYNTMNGLTNNAGQAYAAAAQGYTNEANANATAKQNYISQQNQLAQAYRQAGLNFDLNQQNANNNMNQNLVSEANSLANLNQDQEKNNQTVTSDIIGAAGSAVSDVGKIFSFL